MTGHVFRAVWPVLDERAPLADLITEAEREVPALARQARAAVTGHGRFTIAPSHTVAGSGRVSRLVLLYTAPARPRVAEWPPGGVIARIPGEEAS